MIKRVAFTVPDEPPKHLLALSSKSAHRLTEALRFTMFNYFISLERPQTAMLPRDIIRRAIEKEIVFLCQTMLVFPVFRLDRDRKKFIRCCYQSVWRTLLREWQARLLLAMGKKPRQVRLPVRAEPVLSLRL